MFQEIEDFVNFKDVCRKQGIQFHTFTLNSEEILTVVLKGLIKLDPKIILNNLKTQGLKPIDCTEISNHMKYPIYRITFFLGTTLANVNQDRFIEHIKVYWEKYEAHKPSIQCYCCRRTFLHKLQQKRSLCQVRRSPQHEQMHKNTRRNTYLFKLPRQLHGELLPMSSLPKLPKRKITKHNSNTKTCNNQCSNQP